MKNAIYHETGPLRYFKTNTDFLSKFRSWSWYILLIFSFLQCLFFWSFENFFAVICVLIAYKVAVLYLLRHQMFKEFPLSSFLILGFILSQYYFPVMFTLLEDKPVVFNMKVPVDVFIHSLASAFVVFFAHWIYISNFEVLRFKSRNTIRNLGIFKIPSDLQLWSMGWIGLISMVYVYLFSFGGEGQVGAGGKLTQSLIIFTYAPYFIPLGKLYGKKTAVSKKVFYQLLVYTIALFLVSLGRNSRGSFMFGFTSLGFAFGLALLMGVIRQKLITLKNIVVLGLSVLLFNGPMADLATAMVLVRNQRGTISSMDLIARTLDAYGDKQAIYEYRLASSERGIGSWDEFYLDNVFLARFSNLKYNDISLYEASKVPDNNSDMFHFSIDKVWATLPQPILTLFGINVDKKTINSGSYGDLLFMLSGGGNSLGGFKTGHFAGIGMSAFGWWYLGILFIVLIPTYLLFDILTIKRRVAYSGFVTYAPIVSLAGLVSLTSIFRFLPTESVIDIFIFLFRGWIQMILLYWLMFRVTEQIGQLSPHKTDLNAN